MLHGRCYCGATTLVADSAPETVTYCHCGDCRRLTGAPVAAFAAFAVGSVSIAPDPGLTSAAPGVMRRFCPTCGSALTAEFDYLPDQVYVPVGIMDTVSELAPVMHAHAENCLSWLRIDDELPRSQGSARQDLHAAHGT